jgi:hypothetical protein
MQRRKNWQQHTPSIYYWHDSSWVLCAERVLVRVDLPIVAQ